MVYLIDTFDLKYIDIDKIIESSNTLLIYKSKSKQILKHSQRVGLSNLSRLDFSKIDSDNIIMLDGYNLIYDIYNDDVKEIISLSEHFLELVKYSVENNKIIIIPIYNRLFNIDTNEIVFKKEVIKTKKGIYASTHGTTTLSKIDNIEVIDSFQLKSLIRKISLNSILAT